MKSHRIPLFAALAAVATLAAGCASEGLEEPAMNTVAAPSPADSAEDEVVTEVVTREAAPEKDSDDTGESSSSKKSNKKKGSGSCASLPKDPRDQYADGTAPGRMPTVNSDSDYNYWIADIENHYDPCAEVSWILFRGETGWPDGPAMTAAARSDGIAFYVNGKPDGEMRLIPSVESVDVDGDAVEFHWGERTGYTYEAKFISYSATLSAESGSIEAVSGDVAKFEELWNSTRSQYMLGTYD